LQTLQKSAEKSVRPMFGAVMHVSYCHLANTNKMSTKMSTITVVTCVR